jgi:hypothetical protein
MRPAAVARLWRAAPCQLASMSARAKATLLASVVLTTLTVWGVHHMQDTEREVRPSCRLPCGWPLTDARRICTKAWCATTRGDRTR